MILAVIVKEFRVIVEKDRRVVVFDGGFDCWDRRQLDRYWV